MEYNKIKSKSKLILSLVILVALTSSVSVFAYLNIKKPSTKPEQTQQQIDNQKSNEIKQAAEDNNLGKQNNNSQTTGEPKETPNDNTVSNNTPANASIFIENAAQEGNQINVVAKVVNINSGSCKFNFTAPDGSSLSKSADLAGDKCILKTSALEFSYIGKWSVVASVNNVTSSPSEVNIQ